MRAGLDGRRCLVTGAARGIGRYVTERLVAEGMRATILAVDPDVQRVARELGAQSIVVDLCDDDAARDALAVSMGDDPFWLLVNNAGVFTKTPLLDKSLNEWDYLHQISVRAMVITKQAITPSMRVVGGGRVVNMASMAAKRGTPGEAAYAASKAGVVALSRIAAMELGSKQKMK